MTTRGFEVAEYKARLTRAQSMMSEEGLSALLLTAEADVRYFTGYLTRFWESPSRPWYLVVPVSGLPIAVIPSIGAALMAKTWISDIRTWAAPQPMDDGITLLADALLETVGQSGTVGVPSAIEAYLRMPLADFAKLKTLLPTVQFGSDNTVMARLRAIKSDQEVAKIRQACAIAGRAFDRVPEIAGAGIPLERVFRDFQRLLLEEGADWVPYLAGGAGPDGYDDVISPASEAPLVAGDVLMLDTGAVFDGYFCDYDRNYVVGRTHPDQQSAWDVLQEATAAGREACRVGNTASDVFHAMDRIVTGGAGGSDAGRLGHGLGMQLTEGLSFMAADHTVLEAGMVITLEPGVMMPGGGMMVHEDDFVVRDGGAEQLSPNAPAELMKV